MNPNPTEIRLRKNSGTLVVSFDDGNEFEYNPATRLWVYRLRVSDYTSSGRYTVEMESGDPNEYVISKTCTAYFDIE